MIHHWKLWSSRFRIWKISPKNNLTETFFKKLLKIPFQICKNVCKILNNLSFNQEKCANFLWQVVCKKFAIFIFFCKTCAIRFLMSKAFQKAKFYQNLTSESGSKQRFSLLQAKAGIQAVCLRTQAVSIKARF